MCFPVQAFQDSITHLSGMLSPLIKKKEIATKKMHENSVEKAPQADAVSFQS